MFAWLRIFTLLTLFMGASMACHAAPPSSSVTLQVYGEPRLVMSYMQKDGQAGGLGTELVRAILQQAGFRANFQLIPWARAAFMTQSQPNALIYDIVRSQQREHQYLWIGQMMSPTEEWFYRAAGRNEIVPRSVAEVRSSYSVCVLRKNVTEEILQSDGFVLGKNLFEGDSYNDCARLVKTGAVSLLVDARLFQDKKADAMVHPLMDAVLRLPVGSDQQIHVYLAANLESSPLIVAQLQKALAQLQASGRLEQIQREFELDFIKSAN